MPQVTQGTVKVTVWGATGYVPYHGWAFQALGRACLLLDRLEEAQIRAHRALDCSPHQPGFAAHALHLLGDIATHPHRFDSQSGEAHYRRALALAEPRGMRPLVAHCHPSLGKLYRYAGKRKQAREHVATATAMYRDTGMTYWLEQAEAELGQLRYTWQNRLVGGEPEDGAVSRWVRILLGKHAIATENVRFQVLSLRQCLCQAAEVYGLLEKLIA